MIFSKNRTNVENVINTYRGISMSLIYKTTNSINGKIYIGKSKYNDPSYLGSGVILKQAIEKYGIESFTREVLEECSDDSIDEREIYWIDHYKSFRREIGYNIAKGGTGGDTTTSHPNKVSIIEKRRQGQLSWYESLSESEREHHNEKISLSKKGKSNGRLGTHQTQETIEKIRSSQPEKTDEWKHSHAEAMAKRKGTSLTKKYKRVVVDGIEYESVKHAVAALGLKHAKYFHDMRRTGKIKVEYL